MDGSLNNLLEVIMAGIVVPWTVWVTVSIFQQRQELALLRQIFQLLKDEHQIWHRSTNKKSNP
jgi:hypothetical protein